MVQQWCHVGSLLAVHGQLWIAFYLQRVSVVRLGAEPKICGTIGLGATLSCAVVGPSAS